MDIFRLSSSLKDLKSFNLWQSLFAEFLGTFLLAFIGFGTVFNNMNPVKVGLGFGLAGAVIIYCIGPVSGGNINPAVSFGLLIARQISLIRFILYFFVQTVGATFGCNIIFILTNGTTLAKTILRMNISNLIWTLNNTPILTMDMTNINKTLYNKSVLTTNIQYLIKELSNKTFSDGFIITEKMDEINSTKLNILCEMVITFVLVFTVMRLCVEKSRSATEKGLAPLIIGISITIGVYCGMNISGGSMNPAVSLGAHLSKGNKKIKSHIIGPLIGGFLAGILQQLVFTSNLSLEHIKSYFFSNDFNNNDSSNNERQNDIQLNDKTNTGRYSPNIELVRKS